MHAVTIQFTVIRERFAGLKIQRLRVLQKFSREYLIIVEVIVVCVSIKLSSYLITYTHCYLKEVSHKLNYCTGVFNMQWHEKSNYYTYILLLTAFILYMSIHVCPLTFITEMLH